MAELGTDTVRCPVCAGDFESFQINSHLDRCLQGDNTQRPAAEDSPSENGPPSKKSRVSREDLSRPSTADRSATTGMEPNRSAPVFSLFQSKSKETSNAERSLHMTCTQGAEPLDRKSSKRDVQDVDDVKSEQGSGFPSKQSKPTKSLSTIALDLDKPLADKLRPTTLDEYFGQNKVVGEHTMIRSVLQSQDIPSLILWGPPGCGKTTLAHIIASDSKKKGTARFVPLSATSASTNDVRGVIKQAQNELRLFKRKTILFVDEIHRFNKSQQDTFLPHVECGTVTLIGATTENPSFQVNSALLSRCRVLVLEKLSVEAMGSVLRRATNALGLRVIPANGSSTDLPSTAEQPSELQVDIEQSALDTIAYLCDGDARVGLNGLQLALQARVAAGKANQGQPNGPAQRILIQEEHIKEGLQRSHILYDKAGEEHYNCISAMHKSIRGSHENAALYWLGRMLEGGEDPLYVARRLVRFASEDVGLADPAALPQAVAAFQACHFIGMPECEVILAQTVLYLARAPKSVEVYQAYANVKACVRGHKGPLPSVPLHLRNAPTRLMKDLGYAKGYKYNPAFSGPVEQEYLPKELGDVNFLTWTPSNH